MAVSWCDWRRLWRPYEQPVKRVAPTYKCRIPQYMNSVDLTYRGNEKSRVLVGQPEQTRKAEFWLDNLKRREKQSFGWTVWRDEKSSVLVRQPEETRKAVFWLDSLKRREKQCFGSTAWRDEKSSVLVGQPEETRKAVFWLDSLKRREKQCFGSTAWRDEKSSVLVGQSEETRKAVFWLDSLKRRETQSFDWQPEETMRAVFWLDSLKGRWEQCFGWTAWRDEKSRVSVGQPEETRKAVFWLDSLKRREKRCFGWTVWRDEKNSILVGQPEETRKAVFWLTAWRDEKNSVLVGQSEETRKGWRKNWIPWVKLKTSEHFPVGLLPIYLVHFCHFATQSHSLTKYSTSLKPTMTCFAYSCTQQDLHFKAFNATHVNTQLFRAGVFLWQIRYCWPHNWALVFADSSMPNDLKETRFTDENWRVLWSNLTSFHCGF